MTPDQYADMHKKAFRCAFDYLNDHFPPETDPEWWVQAAKELSDFSVAAGENALVLELLNAVFTYIGKEHERRKDNGSLDSYKDSINRTP